MPSTESNVTIRLSDCQAYQLGCTLDRLIAAQIDSPLGEIQQRLDEAHWLGQWKRDYTQLDLTREEAVDVLHAMIENLDEETPTALTAIVDQLNKILAASGWTDADAIGPKVDDLQQVR